MRFLPLSLLLSALVLLSPSAPAFDAKATGSAQYGANLSWTLDFGATRLPSEATLRIYPPSNTAFQSASYSSDRDYSVQKDEFNNTVLLFTLYPSSSVQEISLAASVSTSFDPSSKNYPPASENPSGFLVQSSLVNTTPEIATIAAATVQGKASNGFQKLALLAEWVNNNIEYDLNWKDFAAGSVETLKARRGTCDEMGHLLIAMLRAQKIPARLVVGYVYSGERWGPHAWVEAMIDGTWVPADPTFGEAGVLDATHVQIAVGRDQDDVRFEVSARGADLDLSQTTVTPKAEFSVKTSENFSNFFSLEAEFPKGFRGSQSKETVYAIVKSLLKKPVAVPVSLNLYEEFRILGYKNRIIALSPAGEENVSWAIVYPSSMRDGYYYDYSAAVTALDKRAEATLKGELGTRTNVDESIAITSMYALAAESGTRLFATVHNNGNVDFENALATVNASGQSQSREFDLAIGEYKTMEFPIQQDYAGMETVRGTVEIRAGRTKTLDQFALTPEKNPPTPTPAPLPQPSLLPNGVQDGLENAVSSAPQGAAQAAEGLSQGIEQALSQTTPENLFTYALLATILILLLVIIKTLLGA
ncbi:MAG: transglutaminase-like domain-containing protein [Candidatus Micrarchaeia archaeon]|jgi:transglutaminase-like putative cysteine protease